MSTVVVVVAILFALAGIAWLLRRPSAVRDVDDASALRAALDDAVRRGDMNAMDRICRANEQAVVDAFPTWARRDPALGPPDRAEIDALIHFLGAVAQHMDRALGRSEPWTTLTAPPGGNPIESWERDLAHARELAAAGRYDESVALLEVLLERTGSLEGSAADELRPLTVGTLGSCLFQAGRGADALPVLEEALAMCEAAGDEEGRRAYRSSLFEVHRYLGNGKVAAAHAEALAQLLADAGDLAGAEEHARAARIVAKGEPKNRMVARIGGRMRELDELAAPVAGEPMRFEFRRDRISIAAATALGGAAAALAERGELDAALETWRAASAIDPHDPDPHYQSGVALLELERFADAAEAFERTEAAAPGWFLCRQYRWLAREIAEERLGPWAAAAAMSVRDDAPGTPQEKAEIAEAALARSPSFSWMYVALGRARRAVGDRDGTVRALRTGIESTTEPCLLSELWFELASTMDPGDDEREKLLMRVIRGEGTLMTAAAARVLRLID